jgi:dTDP-glucose pyrophosphorylase/CBS domain-containing protein
MDANHVINYQDTILHAIKRLNELTIDSKFPLLIVVDSEKKLIGTITDGDIRRYLIKSNSSLNAFVELIAEREPYIIFFDSTVDKEKLKHYKVVPVVNYVNELVEILIYSKSYYSQVKNAKVIINAGGKGTRLLPYTNVLPKPLIQLNHKPMIDYLIEYFVRYGVKQISFILNYKMNLIKAYLTDSWDNLDIRLIEESEPLGSAGGLGYCKQELKDEDTVILMNCDTLINHDLSMIVNFHRESNNKMTIVGVRISDTTPYGVLTTDNYGHLSSIEEKPTRTITISSGLYIINTELLNYIQVGEHLDMDEFIQMMINRKVNIGLYSIDESQWIDVGNLSSLDRANNLLFKSNENE